MQLNIRFANDSSVLSIPAVMTSIDMKARHFSVYYYLQLADTLQYIFMDIFLWIIQEQYSDEGESKGRL